MHRCVRTALLLLSLALPLAACESLSMPSYDFDPTDLIPDWVSSKKKLPGDRKPVFPEGVPGTSRGVPPELVRGYQAGDTGQDTLQASLPREQPKPKTPPAPKAPVQAKPKPAPTSTAAAPPPASGPTTIDSRWPDAPMPQQQQQRPASQQQSGGTQWPDPPAPRSQQSSPSPAMGPGQVQWPDPPAPR
jgi:hypothetical protein